MQTTATLNEIGLRRAGFQPGVQVTLLDGQEWTLAKPRVRFVPADNDQGFDSVLTLPGAEDYHRLASEFYDAFEAKDWRVLVRTQFAIARRLLDVNYELSDDQFRSLVQFPGGPVGSEPGLETLRDDVLAVGLGLNRAAAEGAESAE